MKFNLTITSDSAADLARLLNIMETNGIHTPDNTVTVAPEKPVSIETDAFPDVPDASGKAKKPKKEKPKFVDPGDMTPAAPAPTAEVDAFELPAPAPAPATTGLVELDDFGDPIVKTPPAAAPAPAAPVAPKLTIDLLRTEMQAKSTQSPELKAKCQALIASYNVQTLSMISETLWPEVYAKIKAL